VPDVLTELRSACSQVAERADHVRIDPDRTSAYLGTLPVDLPAPEPDPGAHVTTGTREERAAFWLTLDAINFGSGWFPTLRKRAGRSGYYTVATGLRDRFAAAGPWSPDELSTINAHEIATTLGQDPDHELMRLFARSLNDLGHRVATDHGGHFAAVPDAAESSAVALVDRLATWDSFADTSRYEGLEVPFLKRAQITAADLARAGVAAFHDLDRLTMFADNLVPHVLRLDGLLTYDDKLSDRIDRGEMLDHGSREEIEIRACALHAVELLAEQRAGALAADIDAVLWHRGQEARYKAAPRHRSRCTAY
jgi:Queuosine salvage protein